MTAPHETLPEFSLAGQTIVVTGASGGIGGAIAIACARAGANVIIHYYRHAGRAEQVRLTCADFGARALTVQADLGTESGVQTLLEVARELGPIGVLVNNAGSPLVKLLTDTTLDDWNAVIATNLTSTFLCTKRFLPDMIRRGTGRIINVSSMWGVIGGSCETAYSAAKGGVIGLTKAVAKEVARTGVTVNAIAPGAIDTPMLSSLSPEDRREVEEDIPVGRLGQPTDVSAAVVFLASPAASYITGQVLSPNGGWST